MGVCNCSMFCCTLLYVHSSIAIILMGKRELVALRNLSSWCLVMVEWLFLAVPWGCLRFVIVLFPYHTHYFRIDGSLVYESYPVSRYFGLTGPIAKLVAGPIVFTIVDILTFISSINTASEFVSKQEGKYKEIIQLNTTPVPGHHAGK